MSSIGGFLRRGDGWYLRAVAFVMALTLTTIGLYIVGPWYRGGESATIWELFQHSALRVIPATFYIVAGGYTLAALSFAKFNKKFKGLYVGSFLMVIAWMFMCLLRLLTFGFTPVLWLLMPAILSGVIFLWQSGSEGR